MITLKGEHIYLRALEPEDLEFIYNLENDETLWHFSHTQIPYSRFIIKQYLEMSHKDIYDAKQLRLVICDYEDSSIGLIDLFDFDFKNKRAGLGIVISSEALRGRGYGKEALELLVKYSFNRLQLHQLYCNIEEHNTISLKLFKDQGFEIVGLKKDWNFNVSGFHNEYLLQLINN